jgi:hypothetical protein
MRRGRASRHPRPARPAGCAAIHRTVAQQVARTRSTTHRRPPPSRQQASTNRGAEGVRRRLRRCAEQYSAADRAIQPCLRCRSKGVEWPPQRAAAKGRARASHRERLRINVAENVPFRSYGSYAGSRRPKKRVYRPLFRGVYKSMIPRFSPIVTAWVRSFAPSLVRIFLT